MKIAYTLAAFILGISNLAAEITVDSIFGSGMVLQQGRVIPITGTVTDGPKSVTVQFAGQSVKAEIKGKLWRAKLQPMPASAEGQTMTITQGDTNSVTLDNVRVGEVWLASGQSNMLWRLNQTGDRNAITSANNPHLSFYHNEPQVHTSPSRYNDELKQRLKDGKMYVGSWAVSSPASAPRMSAVGFYFGRKLQEILGVPVGIIHSSLGGSEMMAWMPTKIASKKYRSCLTPKWLESKYMSAWVRGRASFNNSGDSKAPHPYQPTYLYKTGIQPWKNFPIAGVIWYQGESDAEIQDMQQNTALLQDLITGWRAEWKSPELPFLMVQLPRINDNTPLRAYWPEFRHVQAHVADKMQGVDYVVTTDLGSTNSDVHPPRKLEVGERMAHLAAAQVYGKDTPAYGPRVKDMEVADGKLVLSFDHATELKTTDSQPPRHFELAGKNGKYHPADATISGTQIILSSPKVPAPVTARYAWATYLTPNLVNEHNLPAAPFSPEKIGK